MDRLGVPGGCRCDFPVGSIETSATCGSGWDLASAGVGHDWVASSSFGSRSRLQAAAVNVNSQPTGRCRDAGCCGSHRWS